MLNRMRGAGQVKGVTPGRLALARRAVAVGELLAIVCQALVYIEWGLVDDPNKEPGGGGGLLVVQDLQMDPARGPVNGYI